MRHNHSIKIAHGISIIQQGTISVQKLVHNLTKPDSQSSGTYACVFVSNIKSASKRHEGFCFTMESVFSFFAC